MERTDEELRNAQAMLKLIELVEKDIAAGNTRPIDDLWKEIDELDMQEFGSTGWSDS